MGRLLFLLFLTALGTATYLFAGKENQSVFSYLVDDYLENTDANGLLLGSSTLANIHEQYLPSCINWSNRAVGNSKISHTTRYVTFAPRKKNVSRIVLYVGENDIAYGISAEETYLAFSALIGRITEEYPRADIFAILIKPSPARADHFEAFNDFNSRVARMATEVPSLSTLNIMTNTRDTRLFGSDGIHLNVRGYLKLHFELNKVCYD